MSFFKKLDNGVLVTKSAFTQASMYPIKATAFIVPSPDERRELEESYQKAVLDVLYGDENYETAWGFRL
jgi:hypothetical protein